MGRCDCPTPSKPEWRAEPAWGSSKAYLYGYGVRVLVVPHRGECQLTDEVLAAEAIKVAHTA